MAFAVRREQTEAPHGGGRFLTAHASDIRPFWGGGLAGLHPPGGGRLDLRFHVFLPPWAWLLPHQGLQPPGRSGYPPPLPLGFAKLDAYRKLGSEREHLYVGIYGKP